MQDYSIAIQVLQIKWDLLPEGLSTNTYRAEKLKCLENMNLLISNLLHSITTQQLGQWSHTSQVTSLTGHSHSKKLLFLITLLNLLLISTKLRKMCCMVIFAGTFPSKEKITCYLGIQSLPDTSGLLTEILSLNF